MIVSGSSPGGKPSGFILRHSWRASSSRSASVDRCASLLGPFDEHGDDLRVERPPVAFRRSAQRLDRLRRKVTDVHVCHDSDDIELIPHPTWRHQMSEQAMLGRPYPTDHRTSG